LIDFANIRIFYFKKLRFFEKNAKFVISKASSLRFCIKNQLVLTYKFFTTN